LWATLTEHNYKPARDVWELQWKRGSSQAWKAIVTGKEVLRRGIKWAVGDGGSNKIF